MNLLAPPTVTTCRTCGCEYDRAVFDLLPLPVGWDMRNGPPTMGDDETCEVVALRLCANITGTGVCRSTVARVATAEETLAHWMRELGKL